MVIIRLLISILSLILVGKTLTEVDAGCFRGDNELRSDVLRLLRNSNNETLMGEVYGIVDKDLQNRVRTDDLGKNMKAVMRLLRIEVEAEFYKGKRYCLGFGTKPLISEYFDKNVTINALLRLYDLNKIKKAGLDCSVPYTRYLIENNLIAGDTIGRRLRNQIDLLPRIDNLIFDIARQRAEHCLPEYNELLTGILELYCYGLVKDYWDPIFEHRLEALNLTGDKQAAAVFDNNPQEAYALFDSMQNAIEEDEMYIILERLYNASTTSSFKPPYVGTDPNIQRFEKFARTPCANYIDAISDLFESLDFSMQFRPYLPTGAISPIDSAESVIYKLRAYYTMCKKLVKEKGRFVQLLNLYLITSLPYHSDEH